MLALALLAVTPQPNVETEAPNDPLGFVSPKQFAGPYPLSVTGAAMDAACLIRVLLVLLTVVRLVTLLLPEPVTPELLDELPLPVTPATALLSLDELPEPVTLPPVAVAEPPCPPPPP